MDEDGTIQNALDSAFRDGSIRDAADAELERYIQYLGSAPVLNVNVQHRAIIRAHAIDTLRLFRFTQRLEASNGRLAKFVAALTFASVILALASAAVSLVAIRQDEAASRQAGDLVALHREANADQRKLIELQQQAIDRLEALEQLAAGRVKADEAASGSEEPR